MLKSFVSCKEVNNLLNLVTISLSTMSSLFTFLQICWSVLLTFFFIHYTRHFLRKLRLPEVAYQFYTSTSSIYIKMINYHLLSTYLYEYNVTHICTWSSKSIHKTICPQLRFEKQRLRSKRLAFMYVVWSPVRILYLATIGRIPVTDRIQQSSFYDLHLLHLEYV